MQKGDEIDHKNKKVDGSQEQQEQQQQQTSFKDLAHKCSRSKTVVIGTPCTLVTRHDFRQLRSIIMS